MRHFLIRIEYKTCGDKPNHNQHYLGNRRDGTDRSITNIQHPTSYKESPYTNVVCSMLYVFSCAAKDHGVNLDSFSIAICRLEPDVKGQCIDGCVCFDHVQPMQTHSDAGLESLLLRTFYSRPYHTIPQWHPIALECLTRPLQSTVWRSSLSSTAFHLATSSTLTISRKQPGMERASFCARPL